MFKVFLLLCLVCFPFSTQAATPAKDFSTMPDDAKIQLLLPVYVSAPTATSVLLNIVADGPELSATVLYRPESAAPDAWSMVEIPEKTGQIFTLTLDNLQPDTLYVYEVRAKSADSTQANKVDNKGALLSEPNSSFITQRQNKETPYSFVVMTDAHVTPVNPERNGILRSSSNTAATYKPDFVFHLGDNMQTVGSSHGGPLAEPDHGPIFYMHWRHGVGALQSQSAQFYANGNWEGENGWHPEANKKWARQARMLLAPGPDNKTYAQGGSKNQDYYAFTWGDALYVVLNVTGYNTINHEHTRGVGKADDWTLGKEQMAWLEKTLAESKAGWKFILTHHAVGGNAGDDINSRYGRGGGRAAHVGEQAKVHELMKKHGVQAFFYGHDHVFTHMEVEGVHYICTGSVGAPWKFGTEETGYEKYIPDSGFTMVKLNGNKAQVDYIRPEKAQAQGKILYSTSISKN